MDGVLVMYVTYPQKEQESIKTYVWHGLILLAAAWTAVEAPLSFVLGSEITALDLFLDGLFSMIFVADMVHRMSQSKFESETGLWGIDAVHGQRSYLKSIWFPIDLISSLPLDIIASAVGLGAPTSIIKGIRLARLLRLTRLRDMIANNEFLPRPFKGVLFVAGILLGIHLISCGWMVLNPRADLDPITYYNISLYWTVTTLTTVGYGDITPQSNMARIFTMGVMLIGVATYGVIIGNFSRMIMLADKYKEEKKEKMAGLNQFLKFYNIPSSLQRQVFSFYNHLLAQNISEQDTRIINELPQALQNELAIYMKIKLIRNVHIFKDCSTPCLKMIAQRLEQTYLSPNEYIIKKGEIGAEMFIIGHGEVEVTSGEKVLARLKAGQFFGEIALLEDTVRGADVKARAYCDLYTFNKEDFLMVIAKYPDLGLRFKEIYNKRASDREDDSIAA